MGVLLEQNLENTLNMINEINKILSNDNYFSIVEKYDDNYTSSTLEYYEKTIKKYANQKHSNELISFKELKENHYLIYDIIKDIMLDLNNEDLTDNYLKSLLIKHIKTYKEEHITSLEDLEEEEEQPEKIKGFDKSKHFEELLKLKLFNLVCKIKNLEIIEETKKDKKNLGYGFIHNDDIILENKIILKNNKNKYYYSGNEIISIEDRSKKLEELYKEHLQLKYIMDRDFELIGLIEYIYMYKYDRLIKKEIYTQIKKRFFVGQKIYNPMQDGNLFERLKNEAVSFATEGFLIGIRKYSTTSETKLITYVTWWIKQRIVYYIENFSSINKGKKTIYDEESFEIKKDEDGLIKFDKYANIQFENFNFIKSDDIAKYEELEKLQFTNDIFSRHDGKIYDILIFFCKQNHIFLPFEYLLIKYDILLEEYIYFIETANDEDIRNCFYKQIIEVNEILKSRGYEDIMDFNGIKEYYKLPETLMLYFNVEKKEYLTIKRILKQKLINILKNVFLEKKKRKTTYKSKKGE